VRLAFSAVGLLLVVWLLPGRTPQGPFESYHMSLGTLVKFVLYGDHAGESAVGQALAEFTLVDSLMSSYSRNSETSRIGSLAGEGRGLAASRSMIDVIERSMFFAHATGGAFDPTVGALTRLWDFPDAVAPPAETSVDSALALVSYRDLLVDGGRIYLQRRGMQLDLGAAAKGHAVDLAVAALEAAGVKAGLVEAGGDIRFWGRKPDGEAWRFGIRHPRVADCIVLSADVGLSSLATSGDYEQTFDHEQISYHHILDPTTGYPARGAVSATAWANSALDADILSTALFVLGPDGMRWVEDFDGVEALMFYEAAGRLDYLISSGLKGSLQFPDCAAQQIPRTTSEDFSDR